MTEDLAPDGGWVPGGPALYAARMAANLGAKVKLITRVSTGYDRTVFEGIEVHALPAETACRYSNRYDETGARTQLLLAPGEPIALAELEAEDADALVIAPGYHEFEAVPRAGAKVRAVMLQGALRAIDGQRVIAHPNPERQARPLVTPGSFAFLSEEDTPDADGLARSLAKTGANVFVTRAQRGASLFRDGSRVDLAAVRTAGVVDPTGAGDCFAMAFVVRMVETGDIEVASRFALAAGSLAVEGPGIAGIPGRAAIERRLDAEAA